MRWGVKLRRRMIVFLFSIELVGKADFPVITHLNIQAVPGRQFKV